MWISICRKENSIRTDKIPQMYVMLANKESSINMQTMCLWLLKVVSSSFRSSERSLYWHEEFSGVRRHLIKLENLLYLCHLFVILHHAALSAVSLTPLYFYYITLTYTYKSLVCDFHPLTPKSQPQLPPAFDTFVGPPISPFQRDTLHFKSGEGFCT